MGWRVRGERAGAGVNGGRWGLWGVALSDFSASSASSASSSSSSSSFLLSSSSSSSSFFFYPRQKSATASHHFHPRPHRQPISPTANRALFAGCRKARLECRGAPTHLPTRRQHLHNAVFQSNPVRSSVCRRRRSGRYTFEALPFPCGIFE